MEDDRKVTTFCPRCGMPIVWAVWLARAAVELEIAARNCDCALTDAELATLEDALVEALGERGSPAE
jgi:hypothetical protein